MAAAAFPPQRRPGAELAPLRAKPRQRLPPGHGRPRSRRARLLAGLQEAAGHAAAEAQAAAEERAPGRAAALRRGSAGPHGARPPQPLLQPRQRAAGPAAAAGARAGGGAPLGGAFLAGRDRGGPSDPSAITRPSRSLRGDGAEPRGGGRACGWGGLGDGSPSNCFINVPVACVCLASVGVCLQSSFFKNITSVHASYALLSFSSWSLLTKISPAGTRSALKEPTSSP